jgi:hypothetical protein
MVILCHNEFSIVASPQAGKLAEAVELLLGVEKQARLGNDVPSLKEIVLFTIKLCRCAPSEICHACIVLNPISAEGLVSRCDPVGGSSADVPAAFMHVVPPRDRNDWEQLNSTLTLISKRRQQVG